MLKAGILGLGKWGRRLVESVQSVSSQIRFTAAVTGHPERSAEFAAAQSIRLFPSLDDLLADGGCDAVVIATPHSQHAGQIVRCLGARLPVFVEKPVVLSLGELAAVDTALAGTDLLVAAGHNRRFLPAMADLLSEVRAGMIGDILHMEGHLSAAAGYAYRDGSWRADPRESPAGGLAGAGIHVIDLMVAIAGRARHVFGQADRRAISASMDDTTSALVKFRNGASGYLGAVTASAPTFQFRLFGSKGMIAVQGEQHLDTVDLDGGRHTRRYGTVDTERLELEAFARSCAGGPAYPVLYSEVRDGIELFEAVSSSVRTGALVELPVPDAGG